MKKKENLDENLKEEIKKEEIKEEVVEEKDVKEEINIEEEIGKLKAELEDFKSAYLRKQAEFQNYAKRKENEYNELKKYSSENIIKKILPNFDNLERAVVASETSNDFKSLQEGISMIIKSMQELFKSEGVEEIKTDGIFDPAFHHAVMVEESEEHEDNEISKVLEKGYMLNGKVIRPAMVMVYKKINK